MKIKYTKERLRSNLRMGLFFLGAGALFSLFSWLIGETHNKSLLAIGMGQGVTGVLMIGLYNYENHKQYLTIKGDILSKNTLFKQEINLSKINSIRVFAGEYQLKSADKIFTVDTQLIDPKSLSDLNTTLSKLNIRWK